MPPKPRQKTNVALVIFATVFVVAGVLMVAFVASQAKPTPLVVPVSVWASHVVTSTPPVLLLVDAAGARLMVGEKRRTLVWPTDVTLLGQPLSTLRGRMVGDGSEVVLDPEFKIADRSRLRSPDSRHELLAAKAKSDGTGTIEVRYGNESEVLVARLSNGTPIRSIVPVGWWDDDTVAVTGMVTSSRALFAIPLAGAVARVAFLPDAFERLFIENGLAYYVTVTPGEGLEGQDQPPSSIVQVTRDGTIGTLVTEQNLLIDRVIVGTRGWDGMWVLVYHASGADGAQKTVSKLEDGRVFDSVGDSLLILDTGDVLTRQDLKDPSVTSSTAVFLLPHASLDERDGTK